MPLGDSTVPPQPSPRYRQRQRRRSRPQRTPPFQSIGVDAVFSEADGNDAIYRATLAPLLPHVLAGGSATVFAFGQTGSGKSATLGRLQPSPASPSHPGTKLTP